MVTIKSLTEQQIQHVKTNAGRAGDYVMVVICDLALQGSIDLDDYTVLDRGEAARIARMTQEDAYAAIVDAINDREAR